MHKNEIFSLRKCPALKVNIQTSCGFLTLQSWALPVFFHFFNNRKWFCCTFYQVNNLFLHQSYLKSPATPSQINLIKKSKKSFFIIEKNSKIPQVPSSAHLVAVTPSGEKLKSIVKGGDCSVGFSESILRQEWENQVLKQRSYYHTFVYEDEVSQRIQMSSMQLKSDPYRLILRRKMMQIDASGITESLFIPNRCWALSVVFYFFNNKKWFFQVNDLFLHQSYLKSPLPVKLIW